ncbi:hypothetical protein B0T10DRAFT_572557 [Thelonectria olida]|uniref:F-box domain-containing protein n=1 Tax=Thelonectria olida TaxID=1576542 RepID=A0A9P9ALP1_9HYPO|nr:hypothetical protein B0T10DRAFT_572557 [Thelonectria olida]
MGHTQRNWRHGHKKRLAAKRSTRTTSTAHLKPVIDAVTRTDEFFRARDNVFGTYELFEFILSHLDMRTLLIAAQKVCKQWRDLIAVSPLLQQQLFFNHAGKPRRTRSSKMEDEIIHFSKRLLSRWLYQRDAERIYRITTSSPVQGKLAVIAKNTIPLFEEERVGGGYLYVTPQLRTATLTKTGKGGISEVCYTTFPNGFRTGPYYDLHVSALWRMSPHGIYRVVVKWGVSFGSGLSDTVTSRVPEPGVSIEELYYPYGLPRCYHKHTAAMDGCSWLYARKCQRRSVAVTRWMAECEEFEPWDWEMKLRIQDGELDEEAESSQ